MELGKSFIKPVCHGKIKRYRNMKRNYVVRFASAEKMVLVTYKKEFPA